MTQGDGKHRNKAGLLVVNLFSSVWARRETSVMWMWIGISLKPLSCLSVFFFVLFFFCLLVLNDILALKVFTSNIMPIKANGRKLNTTCSAALFPLDPETPSQKTHLSLCSFIKRNKSAKRKRALIHRDAHLAFCSTDTQTHTHTCTHIQSKHVCTPTHTHTEAFYSYSYFWFYLCTHD